VCIAAALAAFCFRQRDRHAAHAERFGKRAINEDRAVVVSRSERGFRNRSTTAE
jgi:hypothetical protein